MNARDKVLGEDETDIIDWVETFSDEVDLVTGEDILSYNAARRIIFDLVGLTWWILLFAVIVSPLLTVIYHIVHRVRKTVSIIFRVNNQKEDFQADDKFTAWFLNSNEQNKTAVLHTINDVEDPDEQIEGRMNDVGDADPKHKPSIDATSGEVNRRRLLQKNDSTYIDGPSIGLYIGSKNMRVTEASESVCWFMMFFPSENPTLSHCFFIALLTSISARVVLSSPAGQHPISILRLWKASNPALENFTLADMTFLSSLSYRSSSIVGSQLDGWFSPSGNDAISIVSVRGTVSSMDLLVDNQLWQAAILAEVVRLALPFGEIFTPILPTLVYSINLMQSQAVQRVSYYKAITRFVNALQENATFTGIGLTGHSLCGGIAMISAARTGVGAVAIRSQCCA
ncbi:hypothetical protein IV203_024064 [Nitzschia inconspicua]|uniref:Fungal lipase-like domain-containing protein n=1 Tax=Nitzschia inconspicua TaxID=303405 RepID=A0A9K3KBW9_9STRA|nr:hypothetical protein IV203_024064 [Nitzschia inconspicua]